MANRFAPFGRFRLKMFEPISDATKRAEQIHHTEIFNPYNGELSHS